ncbi:MAG: ligase-associated DNA damage response DEXH box helicase, partial [Planctomycetota bacterium]
PESATLLLSYPDSRNALSSVRCVIVDEWHELLASKRGVQTELALARLRAWNPELRTWGLSATLGNLEQARDVLLGAASQRGRLITGALPKTTEIDSVLPEDLARFPWAGHLGTKLVEPVLEAIDAANTTLLFTNTRSQTELWFRAILDARPDLLGQVALHHGSLDRGVRTQVEDLLRDGRLRCVVCTSSLDLGVDFSPVDQVVQVGSPKGIARLLQRAGRSGHQPGAPSRVLCVPAHAFELVEFAAARRLAEARDVEERAPIRKPMDVLVQHLVSIGAGGGFDPDAMLEEVRTTFAFSDLTSTEFGWAMNFVTKGGAALGAYPQFKRVRHDDETRQYVVSDDRTARTHRIGIGTITSDASVTVKFVGGATLGSIEESFIARLTPGDRFVFAGRTLELVRSRGMTASVRLAKSKSGVVPRWGGGRSPLSTLLSAEVRALLDDAREGHFKGPEMQTVRPMLELQSRWSALPGPNDLLIEHATSRRGSHTMLFPFEGRLAHEGLGALLAHRIAAQREITLSVTVNDYGVELLSRTPLDLTEDDWRSLLSTDELVPDLLRCLNSSELARRKFRNVARVAGLLHPGFPGGASKTARQLQASSELFFDVFNEFDPANLLLDQARREVLAEQLEIRRLRECLERLAGVHILRIETEHLTPLAFPLWAESLRTQQVSSERWIDRIERMVLQLEKAASQPRRKRSNGRDGGTTQRGDSHARR